MIVCWATDWRHVVGHWQPAVNDNAKVECWADDADSRRQDWYLMNSESVDVMPGTEPQHLSCWRSCVVGSHSSRRRRREDGTKAGRWHCQLHLLTWRRKFGSRQHTGGTWAHAEQRFDRFLPYTRQTVLGQGQLPARPHTAPVEQLKGSPCIALAEFCRWQTTSSTQALSR